MTSGELSGLTLDEIRAKLGWRYWLSWLSPLDPVWLWHALLDGTPLCRCWHSAEYRAAA